MKISAHHSVHGLEGTVRLLDTGETLHIRFPKGKFRAEAQVNIGGHRMETAFQLEMIETKRDAEVDMRIVLEAPSKAKATGKQLPAKPSPKNEEALALDGSPMLGGLPLGAPPPARHMIKDGLPPVFQAEPPPRGLTAREGRDLARMESLEKQLGAAPEAPAPKKKGKAAR